MTTALIIPARLASTRLPEKPLLDIGGQSLIMRVYRQALQVPGADWVCVATDHPSIADHVSAQGGNVVLTSAGHPSGTDRIAEAASSIDCDLVINVQGDEPFIHPQQIDDLIQRMKTDPTVPIATQCRQIEKSEDLFDYNVVKVVRDINQRALYFSRQAIPAFRDVAYAGWLEKAAYFRHVGLYGYRKEVLQTITALTPSSLETAESLEQLRWLENGWAIYCYETSYDSLGIDTPEDLEKARRRVS